VGVGELAYGLKCSARADDRVPNVRPRVESRTRDSVRDSKCCRVPQRTPRTRGSSVACPPFLLLALRVRHRQDEAVTWSRAESLAAHQEKSSSGQAVVRPLAGARVCCKAAERAAVSHAGACSRRRVSRRVCFPPSPPHQGTAPHTRQASSQSAGRRTPSRSCSGARSCRRPPCSHSGRLQALRQGAEASAERAKEASIAASIRSLRDRQRAKSRLVRSLEMLTASALLLSFARPRADSKAPPEWRTHALAQPCVAQPRAVLQHGQCEIQQQR
jgi:hypothetical protein